MGNRREGRISALQLLYQCDALDEWDEAALARCWETFFAESSLKQDDSFLSPLVAGVVAQRSTIDAAITRASAHWSVARMARVDRNVLRIAVYEMAVFDDIPIKVTINEAIEIAKIFGGGDSPVFINGVLDKVARLQEKEGFLSEIQAGAPQSSSS